jgi:hypothetical protein
MQLFHGENYPERVEEFKVYVLAAMSRAQCDEISAVNRLAGVLHEAGRLTGLTLAMLEAAALEVIAQSPAIFTADRPTARPIPVVSQVQESAPPFACL